MRTYDTQESRPESQPLNVQRDGAHFFVDDSHMVTICNAMIFNLPQVQASASPFVNKWWIRWAVTYR